MPFQSLFSSLQSIELYILAAALASARFIGLTFIMPLFSRTRLAGLLRNGVALALAVPAIPMIAEVLARSDIATLRLVAILFKEFLVGLVLGFVLGIPFWAAEAAGDVLDLQRGSTMASLIDPMMTHETSPTGTLLAIVMIMVFLAAGGLELTVTTLYGSYELWPVQRLIPVFSAEAAAIFLSLLTRVFIMALTLAFPLMVSLLLSDVILAFLARASPHLNIFSLSLIVKTLVFSLIFVLYATFLVSYMNRDLSFMREAQGLIESLSCRSCR